MILRIDFVPWPEGEGLWIGDDRGSISRTFPQGAPNPSLLDVQCEAMRDAVALCYKEGPRDEPITMEIATRHSITNYQLTVDVLWRLVPYAASNTMSPRGDTLSGVANG